MIIDKEKFYLKARAKKVACDFDGEKQKKIIFGKRNNSSFLSYNNDTICFLRKLSDR